METPGDRRVSGLQYPGVESSAGLAPLVATWLISAPEPRRQSYYLTFTALPTYRFDPSHANGCYCPKAATVPAL